MHLRRALISILMIASTGASIFVYGQQASRRYEDGSLPIPSRVDDLISQMKLDEKAAQLVNQAPAIPRLGVPAYDYWSEGLHGVARSGYATLFPQAIGMAASWDTPLMGQIATVISTEARAKYTEAVRHDIHSINYGLTFWSPNINIFRDPRWGRGQETYGEDPYLTSRLGVAFVEGLQGTDPNYFRIVATPKHFAVHSGPESTRHRVNVEPTPHDLEDTYLPAFRATIVEAKADSIMCAYNAVDGKPACASDLLLVEKLRRDWKFNGFVVSDCDAVDDIYEKNAHQYSPDKQHAAAEALRAGTDLNCGSTYLALGDAVRAGLIPESAVDASLRRLFTARMRLGLLTSKSSDPYAAIPFSSVNSDTHREIALKAARESIVLLKNAGGVLPLARSVRTIAVVGPNAASLSVIEGNYNAIAKDPVMPLDAIRSEFSQQHVLYSQGSAWAEGARIVAPRTLFRPVAGSAEEGLSAAYYSGTEFAGEPVARRIDPQIDFNWDGAAPVAGVPSNSFSVRWTGTITPPSAGDYTFNLQVSHCWNCVNQNNFAIWLDGVSVATSADTAGERGNVLPFKLSFKDAKAHEIRVEYRHDAPLFGGGIRLEWSPPADLLLEDAVAIAKRADVVLAFVGLSPELEGEEMPIRIEGFSGGDRTDIKLPAAQQKLLEALAATGKPMVVVLLNGSALSVEWAQSHANAIVEAWYPGEAGARAIAETLDGKNNPAGRLPVTFYAGVDQLPAFEDYSMTNRTYRYFKGKPLYRFGDGLSFTTFHYSAVKVSSPRLAAGDTLTVEADVKNAGSLAGDEVAELYLTPPQGGVGPALALEGFQRLHLAAGESKHLRFTLDPRQLSQVAASGTRAVSAGDYTVSVGGSQPGSPEVQKVQFAIVGSKELAP